MARILVSLFLSALLFLAKKHQGPGIKDYPSGVQGFGREILWGVRAHCAHERLHFSPWLTVKSSPDGTGNCVAVSENAQREM